MPKTPRTEAPRPTALRRAWMLKTAPATAAAMAITGVITAGAPAAQAGTTAASATVPTNSAAALVVGGTSFPSMDTSMMSTFTTTFASQLINVSYPAQLYPFTSGDYLGSSVAAGVDNLLGLLNTTYTAGEHLVLWGISQGALVLDSAMQLLATDPSAPPANALTFVRVADPAAPITGMLNFLPNLIFTDLLHCSSAVRTAAADSPYNSIVVTNEYDAFADFPDKPWNALAIANALFGLYYRHGQTAFADLATVPSQDITTTVNSLGATTTTYVVPSPFLPLTAPLRAAGVPTKIVDSLDSVLRPLIDAGYSRNDPAPAGAQATPIPVPVVETTPTRVAARARSAETSARAVTTDSPAVPTPLAATSAKTRAHAASGARSTTHPITTRPSNRTH